MLTPIAELNPTKTEREIAVAQGWVAADLDAGAFLVHVATPFAVAGEPPSPWHLLFMPAAPWPGGTLAELQGDTGYYYRRFIASGDLAEAIDEAGQVLAKWRGR